jgi:hypothetical protein
MSDYIFDMPPNSSRDPKVGPKVKQRKKKRVGACSLTHNTLGVRGHVGASGGN